MQYDIDRTDPNYEKAGEPHIKDMTEKAIQILSKNPKGYFLLVEGAYKTTILLLFTIVS